MLTPTDAGDLTCEGASERPVWRVGYAPEPWAWTPWQYADSGRFSGRWDDPNGVWRSIYAGETPLACYLEVLVQKRHKCLTVQGPSTIRRLRHSRRSPPTTLGNPLV